MQSYEQKLKELEASYDIRKDYEVRVEQLEMELQTNKGQADDVTHQLEEQKKVGPVPMVTMLMTVYADIREQAGRVEGCSGR